MANGDNNDKDNPLKYGVLNPVDQPNKQRYLPTSDSDGPQGNFTRVVDVVRDTLYQGEISVDGEYNGIVLDKGETDSAKTPDISQPWNFMYNWLSNEAGGSVSSELTYHYVRVPEIHAMNPTPESENDRQKIALHDQFLNKSEKGLSIGDIVKVSFYNSDGVWMPHVIQKEGHYKGLYSSKADPKKGSKVGHKKGENSGVTPGYIPKQISKNETTGVKKKKIGDKVVTEFIGSDEYKHYSENRVRVKVFGILEKNSPLAVNVASHGNQEKLHQLAAKRFEALRRAALEEEGLNFKAVSALREHRWRDREHYENYLIKEYGSVEKGDNYVAFDSPHETGLAVDLVSIHDGSGKPGTRDGGPWDDARIRPESDTESKQKQTPEWKWLAENSYRFGFAPYKAEAWHWECLVPLKNWKSGEEFLARDQWSRRVHEYLRENPSITTTQERFIRHV